MSDITLDDIEAALDCGQLWARMSNDKYWVLRRNGKTQRWKRDPSRFYIPVKAGLRLYNQITSDSSVGSLEHVGWHKCAYVICDHDPSMDRPAVAAILG